MRNLKFDKAIFHEGLNFTIRIDSDLDNVGETILLTDTKGLGARISYAEIQMIIHCRIKDIPEFVYDAEHDPWARCKSDLLYLMMKFYPDEEISEYSHVTCIGFELKDFVFVNENFDINIWGAGI